VVLVPQDTTEDDKAVCLGPKGLGTLKDVRRLHLSVAFMPLRVCLALYMVVAWRVLFALMPGRGCPDASCEIVFDPEEWKAAYTVVKRCPPPAVPPPLGEVAALVASLGGYLGRKHDGHPAPRPCGSAFSVCEILSLP
jgi:hypothetical protein